MKIKVVNPDAAPGTVQGTFGVSDKFNDPELQKMLEERIKKTSQAKADKLKADTIREILKNITSDIGVYQEVPRNLLIPTPDEWNRFSAIPADRFIMMAESIYTTGLQQPIVVRIMDEDATKLQILAGNNRNNVYGMLYQLTHDEAYTTIPAIVYGYGVIDDNRAAEIASDTNFLQRGNLTTKDMAFAIYQKATALKNRKEKNIIKKITEQFKFKHTAAYDLLNFYKAPEVFQDMNLDGRLKIRAVARIGSMTDDVQKTLKKYESVLSNDLIKSLPAKATAEEVEKVIIDFIDAQTKPVAQLGEIINFEVSDGRTTITINKELSADTTPIVMSLPEKLQKEVIEKYKKYIFS